ncbi:MAG: hemolysin III family protein, partial [Oscillospiraceae bacterium]|nr:hemolysin III family protein [Oscillospiraceae bacterium]
LLIRASDRWGYVSASVYGASLIILFTMSCLYHAISHPTAKYVMRVFDHTSIFLLIAGTYTPLTLVTLRAEIPWLGWSIFGVVWAAAAVGITLTAVSVERFKKFAMVCYIASGWCIAAAIVPLMKIMDTAGLILMLIGGIGYTVGLVFYALKIKYMHSIWHLFVLGGAVAHYFCVLFYVL